MFTWPERQQDVQQLDTDLLCSFVLIHAGREKTAVLVTGAGQGFQTKPGSRERFLGGKHKPPYAIVASSSVSEALASAAGQRMLVVRACLLCGDIHGGEAGCSLVDLHGSFL